LESPLVGETEVLAQFRLAVRRFTEAAPSTFPLARVLQSVIGVSRVVRRSIGRHYDGSLAVEAARIVSSSERVAILGGGAMAGAVARHLDGPDFALFNRRAITVAGRPSRPWDGVPAALADYPAVVSTIPGSVAPFVDDEYLSFIESRDDPLLFVDIGMPPVLTEPPSDGPLRYMGVDDVAASVEVEPAPQAEEALDRAALAAWRRLSTPRQAGAMISELSLRVDRTVDQQVRRFTNRIAESSDPEPLLRQLAQTVARRVLHHPVSFIGSEALGRSELDLISDMFRLDDE
jgi:glutamyl-tRNA reductase